MTMTRDERLARIAELERWAEDQHLEFEDDAFPDDVQSLWDQNNAELDEHRRVIAQLESRDQRVKNLTDNHVDPSSVPGRGEGGSDRGNPGGSSPRGWAPNVINKMGEHEVYDLNSIRGTGPFDTGGGTQREVKYRAMRAVELANFVHEHANRAQCQDWLTKLLDSRDSEDSQIAKRILLTGSPAYRSAFGKSIVAMLKNGNNPMLSQDEMKAMEHVRAMTIGTGSQGGFAVPYMLDPTVIPTSNLSVNPFRAICRVDTIPGNEWRGVTSAGVQAHYAAEAAEAVDASPTLAQPNLLMQRAQTFVPVSIELTQDWGALQTELATMIQDAKDDLEADKFTNGTGTGEPQGLLTGASQTVSTAGAAGSAGFHIGDLYALEGAVPPRFRPRSQMIANRMVWQLVRQFDTAGGAGLWMFLPQGLPNDVPTSGNLNAQLMGYPANEDSAMPSTLPIATTQQLIVMGDPRYYIIVDRVGLDIEVIPHLFGATNRFPTGQRGFFAYWRNNARVLDPNAFRTLVAA